MITRARKQDVSWARSKSWKEKVTFEKLLVCSIWDIPKDFGKGLINLMGCACERAVLGTRLADFERHQF
jgi:hypothetical protein